MTQLDFDDLRFPQQFVLWASRQWVVTAALPQWRERLLLGGYARLGIPAAATAMSQLLTALTNGEHDRLTLLRPCRTWVSDDERAYLEILAALQGGLNGTATERLGYWCAPDRLRQALSAGRKMTALLSEAGLLLGPLGTNRPLASVACTLH